MKKNSKGFTLIELLIAMSVLTLIAMAFFSFLNSSIKYNKKNEVDIIASNMAQSEIENIREQIKNKNVGNLTTVDGFEVIINDKDPKKYIVNEEFEVTISVSGNNLYTVKVIVKPISDYFSDKETILITKIYGG